MIINMIIDIHIDIIKLDRGCYLILNMGLLYLRTVCTECTLDLRTVLKVRWT